MQEVGEDTISNSNEIGVKPSVKQDQIHDLLFSREIGWQEIIYDLINTEQLNPWDIDITILTEKYLIKIQEIEEADFFVSSKVLLAAALLLRIKSEILLNKYIKSIDEILFGKKEEKKYEMERIELDEEIPELVPRSPMPRFKKVTLNELIEALNKAITTENRRIRKEIVNRNALREVNISMPKKTISIKDKIKDLHLKLNLHFEDNKHQKKIGFTDFVGEDKDARISAFYPLLHLENQKRVWLEQPQHFEEIHIWLKETYLKHNPDPIKMLADELEQIMKIELAREGRRDERRRKREEMKAKGIKTKSKKKEEMTEEELEDLEDEAWENAEIGEEFQEPKLSEEENESSQDEDNS